MGQRPSSDFEQLEREGDGTTLRREDGDDALSLASGCAATEIESPSAALPTFMALEMQQRQLSVTASEPSRRWPGVGGFASMNRSAGGAAAAPIVQPGLMRPPHVPAPVAAELILPSSIPGKQKSGFIIPIYRYEPMGNDPPPPCPAQLSTVLKSSFRAQAHPDPPSQILTIIHFTSSRNRSIETAL